MSLPRNCSAHRPTSPLVTPSTRGYAPDMRHPLPVLLLLLAPFPATEYPARVIGVIDGDTLTVLRDGKTQVRIRLAGIDAAESGQDFVTRAKQTTKKKSAAEPAPAGVVGNSRSKVYHRPDCKDVAAIKEANKVSFATAAEAEKAGYRKAGDCK